MIVWIQLDLTRVYIARWSAAFMAGVDGIARPMRQACFLVERPIPCRLRHPRLTWREPHEPIVAPEPVCATRANRSDVGDAIYDPRCRYCRVEVPGRVDTLLGQIYVGMEYCHLEQSRTLSAPQRQSTCQR